MGAQLLFFMCTTARKFAFFMNFYAHKLVTFELFLNGCQFLTIADLRTF